MNQIPTITAFQDSPDRGQGLARDMTVRWALEEVGQPYEVRLVPFKDTKAPGHMSVHPFGKIPTFEEGDLTIFESGAIVFHIAETRAGLFPKDKNGKARAITWMFAALSTIEPSILEFAAAVIGEKDKSWFEARMPMLKENVRMRLSQFSKHLGDSEWVEGEFSAGDLMLIAVMRRLKRSGLLDEYPNIAAYVARGEARPAFKKAFAAQLAVFEANMPKP